MVNTILNYLTKHYAPYAVVFTPECRSERKRVVYCWSVHDANDWLSCSLRSDRASIILRGCKLYESKLLAVRSPVTEV